MTQGLITILSRITFDNFGSLCSMVGLIFVGVTFWKVRSLKRAVSDLSVRKRLDKLYVVIENIPASKPQPTKTQENAIREFLNYIEAFYISRLWGGQKRERHLIEKIRKELDSSKNASNIKADAAVLRDHILFRG